MRKAHFLGHTAGILNVDARAAGTFLSQRRAVIVKLQGHAHDVITFVGEHGRHNGTVHTTRHRHDDPRVGRCLGKAKRIERRGLIKGHGSLRSLCANIGKSYLVTRAGFTPR